MDIISPKINDYIASMTSNSHLPERDNVLKEMEHYAKLNSFPIIGPVVGRFFRQLVMAIGAKSIFEMGSGFGYSAVWFAGGLPDGGRIICCDGSEQNRQKALDYVRQAGYEANVEFYAGDALDIIKRFDGPFDIIFNDIDKQQYPQAFDLAVPRLRKGGLFITDNVLWSGKILDDDPDEATRGILEFNRKLFEAPDLLASIMPVRDGLGIAAKL